MKKDIYTGEIIYNIAVDVSVEDPEEVKDVLVSLKKSCPRCGANEVMRGAKLQWDFENERIVICRVGLCAHCDACGRIV